MAKLKVNMTLVLTGVSLSSTIGGAVPYDPTLLYGVDYSVPLTEDLNCRPSTYCSVYLPKGVF